MISIDTRQMGSLQEQVDASFIAVEARRLSELAPALAASAGASGMEAAVERGLQIARAAGFRQTRHIRVCIDLVACLGSHYDTDPHYLWLHPLLEADAELSVDERARLLYWHATLYLERAFGKGGVHGNAAAFAIGRLDMATLAAVGADYDELAPQLLARLHPQRLPYLSGTAGHALMDTALQQAPGLGLDSPEGPPLLLCLMFGFGHRVADDPLHPWVGASLSSAPQASGAEKVAALLGKAQSTLATLLRPTVKA